MSPCYICGRPIEELRLDPRDGKTRPCSTCEDIVFDSLTEFDNEPEPEYDEYAAFRYGIDEQEGGDDSSERAEESRDPDA